MYPVTAQPAVVVLGDRGTDPPPGEKLPPRLDGPSWYFLNDIMVNRSQQMYLIVISTYIYRLCFYLILFSILNL